MEALFSFTYFGLHAEALRRGRDWFEKPEWPPLAMWWHHEEAYPIWAEAVRRHAHLHEHGPTPVAFTFKQPFDEEGVPVKLDKARSQALRPSGR